MNVNEIQQLIGTVSGTDFQETIIEVGDVKLTFRRSSIAAPLQQMVLPAAIPVAPATAPQALEAASLPVAPAPPAPELRSDLLDVRSPIVGTFYHAASPSAPPFVSVNDTVRKGDVLCIIEAMKLMNEIESDVSGIIVEILVENGQAVEYDQVLFRIKP